jgi:hypothetical protein
MGLKDRAKAFEVGGASRIAPAYRQAGDSR